MKKIPVLKLQQKDTSMYLLIYDPKGIMELVNIPEKDTSQSSQRPWNENRVKEIARYVAGNEVIAEDISLKKKIKARGIIPNCPIINIHRPVTIEVDGGVYFILLPDTEKEVIDCKGKIEILDGQHRLISFTEEYIDPIIKHSTDTYEMGFVVLDDLTLQEKREIFMIVNDKQEKVEANVLRQIKKWLGLLSKEEEEIYNLIEKLNNEDISPIRGRIAVGGNKVKNGYKLVQVTKILINSKIFDVLNEAKLTEDQQLKTLSHYLQAWDEVYTGMFNNPKHILGKISGLRYILFLFPYIWEILKEQKKHSKKEDIIPILKSLYELNGTKTFESGDKINFRQENLTISLAKRDGQELKNKILLESDVEIFNPGVF